jgi:hypothetical protein
MPEPTNGEAAFAASSRSARTNASVIPTRSGRQRSRYRRQPIKGLLSRATEYSSKCSAATRSFR